MRERLALSCRRSLAGVAVLLACACTSAGPTPRSNGPASLPDLPVDTGRTHVLAELSQPPTLRNVKEVVRLMKRMHPPLLREQGIGGTAVLSLVVDRRGRVETAHVLHPATEPHLDSAAVRMVKWLRFTPGRIRQDSVRVRLEIPMEFGVGF